METTNMLIIKITKLTYLCTIFFMAILLLSFSIHRIFFDGDFLNLNTQFLTFLLNASLVGTMSYLSLPWFIEQELYKFEHKDLFVAILSTFSLIIFYLTLQYT